MYNPINFDFAAAGPAIGQGDDDMRKRQMLAQLLMSQGAQKPTTGSWAEAIPGAMSNILGGYMVGREGRRWTNPDTGMKFGGGLGGLYGR